MNAKIILKAILPPFLIVLIRKLKTNRHGWHGNYASWKEAQAASTGYDTDKILQAVRASLLKVKNGKAVYERDSVIFDEIQYSWPLLSGLLVSAAKNHGRLDVLDFGGSLGSTYFQNKKFLDKLDHVAWNIVEQQHFVNVGRKEFEDDKLKFYYTIDECVKKAQPNVLLLSSVLQYVEKPYELLDEILSYGFEYILIDRTPFSLGNQNKIKLQIVPPSIYEASYPCWIFNESCFINYFILKEYRIIESFDGSDIKSNDCQFKGMILGR